MRYVTFLHDGKRRPGTVDGPQIRPLEVASLEAYIALPAADRGKVSSGRPVALDGAPLLAPVRPHKNVFCIGRNYLAHAEEGARAHGTPLNLPKVPTIFTKAPTAIADPGQTVKFAAAISRQYDWEAELAVIIGRRCRDVAEIDALDVIFGYSCLNDLTARDLQKEHQQWFKGKSLDDSCPIGPWIVGTDEISDPQALEIMLRVNGVEKQHSNTSNMIFNLSTIIAQLSRGMTLEPGDVIATGTPEGVGMGRVPPEFLKNGDLVEVEIERIGILKNAISIT